jgi:primosomal protein N' (replication factor Y)
MEDRRRTMTQLEEPAAAQPRFVDVALKLPLRTEFTYRLPAGMDARPGNRVRVPFRGKTMPGVVIAVRDACDLDPKKVRDVDAILDASLTLPDAVLALARRIAQDYGSSLGEALDAALPAVAKLRGARRIPHLALHVSHAVAQQAVLELEDKHPARARVLRAVLDFGAPMPLFEAMRRTGTSASPWKTLVKHGLLRRISLAEEGETWQPAPGMGAADVTLNDDQQRAVEEVIRALDTPAPGTFLLHGVTGSGKTEVYLRILAEVRRRGRTGIVLVPEIALTPQTVGRFASRFPDVAVLHSALTGAERGRQWRRLLDGSASIAVGARSALFAPVQNLGLIVVDEEHESSFKQDSTPRYHAREMAVERGRLEGAAVVLGSATPTLESYGRARRGVYRLLELPQRAGLGKLPRIVVEDLRHEGKDAVVDGVVLSRTLQVLMEERLRARDQILLFLNRRGFAPVLICPTCGTPIKCARCDVSMTFHRRRGRLVCHYCCSEQRRPEMCPVCEHAGFHELGAGTERLAAAVQKRFPQAVVARMDADTMAERGAHERVLVAFRARQIDVLVGTQMIAKGHDFPDVTLVGVVSADTGLFLPDFRAAERTFQLLYQVAGRAGRAEKPGIVVFQSLCPESYAVAAAAALDYEAFVRRELGYRKQLGYPPFSRLIRVLFEARRDADAQEAARQVRSSLPQGQGFEVLGPAPAVLGRIKDRFRHHLIVKCFTGPAFEAAMGVLRSVEDLTTPRLRVTLDVDPLSML